MTIEHGRDDAAIQESKPVVVLGMLGELGDGDGDFPFRMTA
jgi:hypothetical protein